MDSTVATKAKEAHSLITGWSAVGTEQRRKETEEKQSRGIGGQSVWTLVSSKVAYRIQLTEFSHKPSQAFSIAPTFLSEVGEVKVTCPRWQFAKSCWHGLLSANHKWNAASLNETPSNRSIIDVDGDF